jgi:hypothetical protein
VPGCTYPKSIGSLLTLNAALFTYMFSSFYIKSYTKKSKSKPEIDEKKIVYDENCNEMKDDGKLKMN